MIMVDAAAMKKYVNAKPKGTKKPVKKSGKKAGCK